MAESQTIAESFRRYFRVLPAVSIEDLRKTYRIRYRVYCEEFGYEPADRFPDKMETDEADPVSVHSLILHEPTGMPAGCVRICPGSVKGVARQLPFEQCCADSLDPLLRESAPADRERICEASRFAVDGAFRRRSGEAATRFGEIETLAFSDTERRTFPLISMALLLACASVSRSLGRPYMYAVMEPFLPRLLKRTGIHFHRLGRDVNHHGIRAVYIADTAEFAENVAPDFRDLYESIYATLSAGLVDSHGQAAGG